MYYVVGDVHGEFELLLELEKQLPRDAQLIFVGDLIDRGPDSKEVIEFVRENNCLCVRGNHEEYMIAQLSCDFVNWEEDISFYEWMESGGVMTLFSYGIREDYQSFFNNPKNINHPFFNDARWLSTLPYYIELEIPRIDGRNVVISHSSVSAMWDKRHTSEFNSYVISNRKKPVDEKGIFNIYGHTPTKNVTINSFCASVDTGAYRSKKLSALEIPSMTIFST